MVKTFSYILLLLTIITFIGCKVDETTSTDDKVATPEFDPKGGIFTSPQQVSISCLTEEAKIYYSLDDSEPNESSILYDTTTVIEIDSIAVIKARAYKEEMNPSDSAIAVFVIDIPTVADPIFSPQGGSYNTIQSVSISCQTEGAAIYYTLDETEPDESSTEFTEDIEIDTVTTIKAIAYKEGMDSSGVSIAIFNIDLEDVATPIFYPSPDSTYAPPLEVIILCGTADADIFYTTDSSEPNRNSGQFSRDFPIIVNSTQTIRAIAYKDGMDPSLVGSAIYTIVP